MAEHLVQRDQPPGGPGLGGVSRQPRNRPALLRSAVGHVRLLVLALLAIGGIRQAIGGDDAGDRLPDDTAAAPRSAVGRPHWTTSRVIGSPNPPAPYTVRRALPHLTFKEPVHLLLGPHRRRLFVTLRGGRIVSFPDRQDADRKDPFLQLDADTYSIAFHPHFDRHPYVYVFSNTAPRRKPGEIASNRILRFRVADADPPRALPETEQVVLEYRSDGHNGGDLAFGPDGFLYISSGDGTGDSDGWNTGQDITDLTSGMIRIDVDHPDQQHNYGIPADNPFLEIEGARPELWAYGFRNPWRLSFDARTGDLFVGDVGQDLWEMVHRVVRGGNYGWSVMEGNHPFHPFKQRGPTPILPPLVEHHHTEARSVTGGLVYRGTRLDQLKGAYIYGDYETGKIWALRHKGNEVTWHKELADTSLRIVAFAVGSDDRLYLVAHLSGEIYELVPAPAPKQAHRFPTRLSETGLFQSTQPLTPAPGLIPYDVVAPQWSDGMLAQRYIGLPGEGRITFAQAGAWQFPEATVLVKTLALPPTSGGPAAGRYLETQILTLQGGQWSGYSYVWNDAQTDAILAPAEGRDRRVGGGDRGAAGATSAWRIVSRSECMVCHSRAAGFVLGPRTAQMNRPYPYASGTDNQLRKLDQWHVFTQPLPGAPDALPRLPDPYDSAADLGARARAYLQANCAHCHVGAGGGNAKITLSFETPLEEMDLVGGRPLHADFGIPGAMLVAPGDPDRSILYQRISRRGNGQMPPLGTDQVDPRAVRLIGQWIKQIEIPPSAQEAVDRAIAATQGASGVLARWRVAGPFPASPADDQLAASSRAPRGPPPAKANRELGPWRRAIGQGRECRVDLTATGNPSSAACWLARTDLAVEQPCQVQLLAEASATVDFWINGRRIGTLGGQRQPPGGSRTFDATLEKGRNRLLLRISARQPISPFFQVGFRRKSANPRHERLTRAALARRGNPSRGRALFFAAAKTQCVKCHRAGGEGGQVGPDLTGVGQRLSKVRIIESILEPNRTVAPQYRTLVVELTDGRVLKGVLHDESHDAITLATDQGQQIVLSKSSIVAQQQQPLSLMPEGLEKGLDDDEFIDLVTFLAGLTP